MAFAKDFFVLKQCWFTTYDIIYIKCNISSTFLETNVPHLAFWNTDNYFKHVSFVCLTLNIFSTEACDVVTTTRTIYETPKKKERAPQTKYIRNLKDKDYNETKPGQDAGKNASYSSCGDHTIRRVTASLWYLHATAIVLLFACRWQILHCVSRTYNSCAMTLLTMTCRKTKTSWMHDINTPQKVGQMYLKPCKTNVGYIFIIRARTLT